MTRKDYELIAAALNSAKPALTPEREAWEDCCRAIAKACKKDNPAFKRSKFFTACGAITKPAATMMKD